MAATAACCIFLQSLFVPGHKLRAGRPALATYYDQFGAAHTHRHTHPHTHTLVQHSHTKRSRHCVEARANTLLLLYLVGAGAQQALQAAARRLVSLLLSLLLLLLLLARPTSCGRARLAWVASQSTHTHRDTQAGTHAPRHAAASDVPRRDDVAHRTSTRLHLLAALTRPHNSIDYQKGKSIERIRSHAAAGEVDRLRECN